ncbi:DUF6092 family protein [Pseudonocardia bannensis]|uniref:Uncharacterized protein n=1 Tax=Pseudonocardia bannensis TaxID=630973 RepID=A0A848DEB9_9PSEU|nr:DUF6092 family protein [Pseudonocardia bannensis]NMH90917.1 hypothetical protein [Pseudonocardia bannensis]
MAPPLVLDEDQALELLAYLVTAARTQVDEAAEYGPMRLLTAAGRLAAMIRPRASEGLQDVLAGPLGSVPPTAVPRTGREAYVARLDGICRELAEHLSIRFAPGCRTTVTPG